MGVVYRVHDPALKRTLAVKVLLRHHQDNPDLKRRFLEEAELMAQLQHPGIAPLHDVGALPEGRPYFSMKLIRGRTLAQLLQERPSPTHDLPGFLAIFGQLCQTLAYAHDRHLLHRDLKPSNVMVGAFGEVQVMDWGLAKVLGSQRTSEAGNQPDDTSALAPVVRTGEDLATHAGAILGTPAFMAPEQACGEIARLDERADVFGLGAILCVLLTGQPPYVGLTKAEVYRQAKEGALTDAYARLQACGADAELVRLAKACLTPDLAERPRHAGVVADAVAAYQARVQERLRQAEVAQAQAQVKVAEERKRRRVTVALAVTVLAVVLLGGGGWWWLEQDWAARRQQTTSGVNRALGKLEQLREQLRTLRRDDPSRAAEALALWEQALAAVEQAQGVLQAGLAEEDLQQRVDGLHQEVKTALVQQRKEVKLLAALDHARGLATLSQEGQWAYRAAAEAYARALAEYSGLAVRTASAETLVRWLQRCPAAMVEPLLVALEDWAGFAGEGPDRQRLWDVLDRVDQDPWRRSYSAALKEPDTVRLRQLTEEAKGKSLPAGALLRLGTTLSARGDKGLALALLRAAQASYPDDFWLNIALGNMLRDLKGQQPELLEEALGFYRAALALRPRSAPAHNNLGLALYYKKDLAGAIASYDKALALDPHNAKTHFNLGLALYDQKDLAGAIASFQKGLALDPNETKAYHNLGTALYDQKDLAGAIASFQKALKIDPTLVKVHINLGTALREKKDLAGAIAAYRKALALDPTDTKAHNGLGLALFDQKDLAGAIAAFQKALALAPNHAPAHHGLGLALHAKKDLAGAIAAYRKALALDPKDALTHYNLGTALYDQKDLAGAIAAFQKALTLDPNFAPAHLNLGNALYDQKDLTGAIAALQKALALAPNLVEVHINLGNALREKKDLVGAIASYKQALILAPNYGPTHYNLGLTLRETGEFAKSLAAFRSFRKLAAGQPDGKQRAAQQVRWAEQLLELDAKLPQLLKGEVQPSDANQGLILRQLCYWKELHAAAARFARDAFTAQPQIADQLQTWHRYSAACSAALAGCGQGKDAPQDAKEHALLRQQALKWLRADLTLWSKHLDSDTLPARAQVRQTLQHWQRDPDLAGVRDAKTLAQLPEAERAAWQQFWADVETLLKKAAAANSP
jgi:tetratricopeptide (TPR) repeat protein